MPATNFYRNNKTMVDAQMKSRITFALIALFTVFALVYAPVLIGHVALTNPHYHLRSDVPIYQMGCAFAVFAIFIITCEVIHAILYIGLVLTQTSLQVNYFPRGDRHILEVGFQDVQLDSGHTQRLYNIEYVPKSVLVRVVVSYTINTIALFVLAYHALFVHAVVAFAIGAIVIDTCFAICNLIYDNIYIIVNR